MTTAAQFAAIEGAMSARLSHTTRLVPIVVLPGVMGSRLRTANGHLVWNPMGRPLGSSPERAAMADHRLRMMRTPLHPAELTFSDEERSAAYAALSAAEVPEADLPPSLLDRAAAAITAPAVGRAVREESREDREEDLLHVVRALYVRRYGALIDDFYGQLVHRLAFQLAQHLPAGVTPKVYCCGYDWRQSNATSAARLAGVVAEARRECDASQVILIAHSMGGLVARYFCRNLTGESQVRALFLLGSPTLGAPKPYLLLKRGIPETELRFAVSGNPFGERASRDICRTMPSAYELCANATYCAHVDPSFARFDPSKTGVPPSGPSAGASRFSDAKHPYEFYSDIYTGVRDVVEQRVDNMALMASALAFHRSLGADTGRVYMHPTTHAIFTKDMETVVGLDLPLERIDHVPEGNYNVATLGEVDAVRGVHGDTAVPFTSACPDDSLLTNPLAGRHELHGVEHVAMANDPSVYAYLKRVIPTLL